MNHGNINNKTKSNGSPPSGLDRFVAGWNHKMSRLLGKNKHSRGPQPGTTSDLGFIIVIICALSFLWSATGFYYLNTNEYGLVFRNGKLVDVRQGVQFGVLLPYPWDHMQAINGNVSDLIQLGRQSANESEYIVLSKDLEPVAVIADFTYQVVDPKLLYQNFLPKDGEIDRAVLWNVEVYLHHYIAQKTATELQGASLIVIANELRDEMNKKFAPNGVQVVKLNLSGLSSPQFNNMAQANNKANGDVATTDSSLVMRSTPVVSSAVEAMSAQSQVHSVIADELLFEADNYNRNQIAQTYANIDRFNTLLPEYHKNPQAIVEQLYYDMFAAVPIKQTNDYNLLRQSLSDLIMAAHANEEASARDPKENDAFNKSDSRSVVRERNFDGRS